MKINKRHLKSLIKECLLEILVEAGGGEKALVETRKATVRSAKRNLPRRTALDNINFSRPSKPAVNKPKRQRPIDVSQITNDPIMTSILQDTARTTLVEQTSAEGRRPVANLDRAAQAVADNDLGEIFGDAVTNWETIAFAQSKPV